MSYIELHFMPQFEETKTKRRAPRKRRFHSGWWLLPAIALAVPIWIILIRSILSLF